jgi:hypothetical protein
MRSLFLAEVNKKKQEKAQVEVAEKSFISKIVSFLKSKVTK